MAICFARHGAEKCVEWSKLCNVVDWKYFGALSDSDKQCLTSYITVHTCAAKYGKVFCSKMQSACYQILGETVRSGAVVLMPPNVAYCMTSEHYLAICYAKFGAAKCIQWRQICSIPINYKELMVSQEECVTSYVMIQSLVQNCQASSSQPFCTHVQQSCSAIGVKIVVKPTPPKLVLPQPTDVDMRLCYTKYGIVGCEEMLRKCFISPAMINIVLDGFKRDCLKRRKLCDSMGSAHFFLATRRIEII
ncbi:unnamed protein product [Anisakis simplex]|uniref:AMP-binding domain-containing protein n=1 Tax=Anisakis simplex TaxID=6269 RepID=A0A0M3J335_ANISI|nr:unnamed protein product [Anisakis simplex]